MKESIKNTILDVLGNRTKYINGQDEEIKFVDKKNSTVDNDIVLTTDTGKIRVGCYRNSEKFYLKISDVRHHFSNKIVGKNIRGQFLEITEDQFNEIWGR